MPIMNPFETDENGFYRVTEPVEGMAPDTFSVTVNGRTYRLSDYAGRDIESHVLPDVLVYRDLEVVE